MDLATGDVWGDVAHCPLSDLMESGRTLYELAKTVSHKGLWGMGKAYDDDCYVLTTNKAFKVTTPHPGPFSSTGRVPYWIALHGPRHLEPYEAWVGRIEA